MFFTKDELNFLEIFNLCADSSHPMCEVMEMEVDSKKNKVIFSMFGMHASVITEITKEVNKDFIVQYPIRTLHQMWKICSAEHGDTFEITEKYIRFSEQNKYQIQSSNYDYSAKKFFLNLEKNPPVEKYVISDLEKISTVKNFIGSDKEFAALALIRNHFIGTDKIYITSVIKTNNNVNRIVYFPKILSDVILSCSLPDIEILRHEVENEESKEMMGVFLFRVGTTTIYFYDKVYKIPDIFEDKIKKIYDHPYQISIPKNQLKFALQKMNIIVKEDEKGAVVIKINDDGILLEGRNIKQDYAFEKISCATDKNLVGSSICTVSRYLYKIVSALKGKNIVIKTKPEDVRVVTVTDENKDMMFIMSVFSDVENV